MSTTSCRLVLRQSVIVTDTLSTVAIASSSAPALQAQSVITPTILSAASPPRTNASTTSATLPTSRPRQIALTDSLLVVPVWRSIRMPRSALPLKVSLPARYLDSLATTASTAGVCAAAKGDGRDVGEWKVNGLFAQTKVECSEVSLGIGESSCHDDHPVDFHAIHNFR
ncbi:uncharacterized protein MYCGRDRAFT_104779, partial [Zymoseptoria tritici IPO323]